MLNKETILLNLNELHEHKMAKEIFVPVLKKMGLKGVKFTGGSSEIGIDIEYYELTQPENDKSYVGIQFKKGDLVYSSGGAKNSVKEVRNQAEEAFEKEIVDINGKAIRYISRFIVATTGDINEAARIIIGKARSKGADRRIDYWTGDRLAEYIQDYWMNEFITYFNISSEDEIEDSETVVDAEYIEENFEKLVQKCRQLRCTVNGGEWRVISAVLTTYVENQCVPPTLAELLIELGKTEEFYSEEFSHLGRDLKYLDFEDGTVGLMNQATNLVKLHEAIADEISEAGENTDNALPILFDLIQ